MPLITLDYADYPDGAPSGHTHFGPGSTAVSSGVVATAGLASGDFGGATVDLTAGAATLRVHGQVQIDRVDVGPVQPNGAQGRPAGGLVLCYSEGPGTLGFLGFRLSCTYSKAALAVNTVFRVVAQGSRAGNSFVHDDPFPLGEFLSTGAVVNVEARYTRGVGGADGALEYRAWKEGASVPRYASVAVPDAYATTGPGGFVDLGDADGYGSNTQWLSMELEGDFPPPPTTPDTPSVAIDAIGNTTVELSGSAYSEAGSGAHTLTEARVRRLTDLAVLGGPVSLGAVTTGTVSGLPSSTPGLIGEMRYGNHAGFWSDWGVSSAFATTGPPAAPSVLVTGVTSVTVQITGSAFVSSSSSHMSSQFRVYRDSDSEIVYDSGTVDATEGPVLVAGLVQSTLYVAEVRYLDTAGQWSEWGASVAFFTQDGGSRLITDYGTLRRAIARWLNRRDLDEEIPVFIQLAETAFTRDPRCRVQVRDTVSITGDALALPSAFKIPEAWGHDGPTYFGPIETVPYERLGSLKAQFGPTGVPRFVAYVAGTAYFAPVPNSTYPTVRVYWAGPTPLSDSNTTNALLLAHPDLYLYGALVHSAPYLKDDPRVTLWQTMYDGMLAKLDEANWHKEFGGGLMRRITRPIGG